MFVCMETRRSSPQGRLLALLALASLVWLSTITGWSADDNQGREIWVGTWATAPQPFMPGALETFRNESLRLIVHTSAGGAKARIRVSNTYGDQPLLIGAAHIARRTVGSNIDPASDRTLKFGGHTSTIIPARSMVVSDPVDLQIPPLSDLAVSLFLPKAAEATTSHILAMQTSYVSSEAGDSCAAVKFPAGKQLHSWPFLTGVDVATSSGGMAIVAFGSSLTDGDGSTMDANMRWPNVLADRLQQQGGIWNKIGVLNEGLIGNRLLSDSPQQPGSPFGAALGQSGLSRFERDVLDQAGIKYVIVALGINDIAMPGTITPASEMVSAEAMISGYRQLIAQAHRKGILIIGSTNPPFENAFLKGSSYRFYTPEKENVRQEVNGWIRAGGEFDGVIDFDEVVRDPSHPSRLLPAYDSGDHFHPNDAGNAASGKAVPLALFR
jgi:lysophospholipase L1-like esterase